MNEHFFKLSPVNTVDNCLKKKVREKAFLNNLIIILERIFIQKYYLKNVKPRSCMTSSLYICCLNNFQLCNFSQDIFNIRFYQWNKNLENP